MDSETQDESGLIPGINPYLQNIAENSIDDLSGKNNVEYESQIQQTNSYNMESNIEIHQGDNTFIQHTEFHETTTETEVYQENIPVTQAGTEYMLEQGGENVYMPDTSNISAQEYPTEVVTDQVVDSVVNGNEASNYVYEEQTVQETYEEQIPQETEIQEEATAEPVGEEDQFSENATEPIAEHEHITGESVTEESIMVAPEVAEETSMEQTDAADQIQDQQAAEMEAPVEDRNEESVDHNLVIAENIEKVEQPGEEQLVKEEHRVSIVHQTAEESSEHTMEVVEEGSTIDVSESVSEDVLETTNASDEPSQEIYRVVETEEAEQSFEESADQTEETLVLIHSYEDVTNESSADAAEDDDDEDEPLEEPHDDSDASRDAAAPKQRGRRSSHSVPLHILGHHLERPADAVANGRSAKPRLGVKVPYRNLTSQIVTKDEIQKEIVERGKRKQMEAARGDNVFARQLTKRLASKLCATTKGIKTEEPQVEKLVESMQRDSNETENTVSEPTKASEIRDNNDLLAILEGDDGDDIPPVLSKEVVAKPTSSNEESEKLREMEREIALQQLHDLPYLTPTQKPLKGRKAAVLAAQVKKEKEKVAKEEKLEKKPEQAEKAEPRIFSSPAKPSNKENTTKTTADKKEITKKIPIEVEPQIKVNMALKTYSRKRKASETISSPVDVKKLAPNDSVDIKPTKIDIPPDAYVTKSSRVIKRKVIWDPDEARSPRPYSRSSDVGSMSPRPGQSKVEKPVEKPIEKKPFVEKPKEEKKEDKKERRVYERVPKKEAVPDKTPKKEVTPDKVPKKEVATEKTPKKEPAPEKPPLPEKSPKKEPTGEPTKKSPMKLAKTGKKSRTEVDKLLGDEGAIKMLYELKNDGEPAFKKKKDTISVTRTFKELRKKANELKSDLESSTSAEAPKNLRKKDSRDNSSPAPATNSPSSSPASKQSVAAAVSRQKSKDSARSSLHTPPPSPGFVPDADTYLIRRRSSSSVSSSDGAAAGGEEGRPAKRQGGGDAPPKGKRGRRSVVEVKKAPATPEEREACAEKLENIKKKLRKTEEKAEDQYHTFSILKSGKHINVDLHYNNRDSFCSVQVLQELTSVLNNYATDKDCYVLSITSSAAAFCLGLPYKSLVSNDGEEVNRKATELANHVRDFLLSLLHFPKILVAGIQGDCSGLAVLMLPLFDVVVASDTATFSTPYTALGCGAEAGFLLGLPQINRGFAANLLYTSNVQSADEAFKGGLVSKLCWPEKYKDTLKALLISISKGSKQSLESNKAQLQSPVLAEAEQAITACADQLVEHWTSGECQKNFAVRALGN